MSGSYQRAVFELRAGSVLRGQANVRFNYSHLALLHDHHRHKFHADQKWIQRVCSIEQRVVLQPDMSAVIEESLEGRIVFGQMSFAPYHGFDNLSCERKSARPC